MTTHDAVIDWSFENQLADEDYLAGRYSRVHTIAFDGGLTLQASASPSAAPIAWSKKDAADPEELLVASASSCHMLWFLDIARRAGLVVRRYHDEPFGTMGAMDDGSIGIVRVILRPAVTFAGQSPSAETLDALHEKAHALCNIANSLKGEVVVEPNITDGAGE